MASNPRERRGYNRYALCAGSLNEADTAFSRAGCFMFNVRRVPKAVCALTPHPPKSKDAGAMKHAVDCVKRGCARQNQPQQANFFYVFRRRGYCGWSSTQLCFDPDHRPPRDNRGGGKVRVDQYHRDG